jgi:hypothetical protein
MEELVRGTNRKVTGVSYIRNKRRHIIDIKYEFMHLLIEIESFVKAYDNSAVIYDS